MINKQFFRELAGNVSRPGYLARYIVILTLICGAGRARAQGAAAGGDHSLLLKLDGSVWTCGLNDVGQLGNGTTVSHTLPQRLGSVTHVRAVAAGKSTSLLLKNDGTVWGCGANANGQLGNNSTTNSLIPVMVVGLSGHTIRAIATGGHHSLFVADDGFVYACGYNLYGELGIGTNTDEHIPVHINGLSDVVAVAAGEYFSLFLTNDGHVYSCGYNGNGQLGIGSTSNTNTPVLVTDNMMGISAGIAHSLFLKNDHSAWSCGLNSKGQLGIGSTTQSTVPVPVTGQGQDIYEVSAGQYHSLFRNNDGSAWTCGDNTYGQLGDGTTTQRLVAVHTSTVNFLGYVTSISGGGTHSVIVENDCRIFATGNNASGQLGDPGHSPLTDPTLEFGLCSSSCSVDASDFSVGSATNTCLGLPSTVSVSSSTVPPGNYTATYTLSGASGNNATFTSAPFSLSGGGSFSIDAAVLTNTGATTVTVNYLSEGICNSSLFSSGNSANFSVDPGAAIMGATTVVVNNTITLSSSTGGGAWSSANTNVATISASGVVTGVAPGTAMIYYTLAGGCTASYTLTVTSLVPLSTTVCVGQQITLDNGGIPGGTWYSASGSIATVNSLGVVSGVGAGNVVIRYFPPASAVMTTTVTVRPLSQTMGSSSVCEGQSTAYINATHGGGIWSSSNTLASVNSTGVVVGTGAGTSVISFTAGNGCVALKSITINQSPVLSGTVLACVGQSMQLSSSMAGGMWQSSAGSVAAVSAAGVVTGIAAGTAHISYVASTGCQRSVTVTVNPLSGITGVSSVCAGQPVTLANATLGGGAWISGNTSIAVINSSGVVTGVTSGNVAVSFTTTAGCITTRTVSVAGGVTIDGPAIVCSGQTILLSASAAGGTWSSSNNGAATVSNTGTVTGVEGSTVRISYMLAGCQTVFTVTVRQLYPTYGASTVCQNQTTTFTNTSGGAWSSANTVIALVNVSGIVTGVSGGNTAILYTAANACVYTKTINVTGTATISGTATVCAGQNTILSNSSGGGNWNSSNGSLATVSASGVVHGVAAGSPVIYYVLGSGCWSATTITVKPLSPTNGGTASMCQSGSMTLTNTTPGGGVWTSSNTTIATVSTAGLVRGQGAGVIIISFTTGLGCVQTRTVTVNACREAQSEESAPSVDIMTNTAASVNLFPNPNQGFFTLSGQLNVATDQVTIEVFNMVGQVVYRDTVKLENGIVEHKCVLDNSIANGNYILRLSNEEFSKVLRFTISR